MPTAAAAGEEEVGGVRASRLVVSSSSSDEISDRSGGPLGVYVLLSGELFLLFFFCLSYRNNTVSDL